MISGNFLLFKDIKISLGILITAWKMHALFRENRYLKVSTTTNNVISLCFRTQNSEQILVLSILLNKKKNNVISSPYESCDFRWGQEGGSVSRVNIGRLITTSVTSRHTSMFFKMAGNFLVRHFCKR